VADALFLTLAEVIETSLAIDRGFARAKTPSSQRNLS
jgi:hypothetical protein